MSLDRAGNHRRDAHKINLGKRKSRFSDEIGRGDKNDFYTFRLRSSSNIQINLSGLKADANLELLNRRGNVIAGSENRGKNQESIQINELDRGKYYVRVYQERGNTKYKLRFSSTDTDDTTLPQDDLAGAKLHPFIQKVLDLTNLQRIRAGLRALIFDGQLTQAAQQHSESMANNDFFSHTGADGSSPFDRISAQHYRYQLAAENIAAGFTTPESVVDAWMNSPGHRANIMNPNLREIGIGYYYLASDTGTVNYNHYWSQSFGTPL